MKKLDKRLLRMIKVTKGQYIAVVLIIVTGIFIFTAIKNSALNLRDTVNDYYDSANFGDIFVTAVSLPEKLEKELTGIQNIKEAEARLVLDVPLILSKEDKNINVRIVSIDKSENKINKLFINDGKRSLSEKNIIVIKQFADARKIKLHDEIKLKINGRQHTFNVTGIASSPEYVYMMENEQKLMPDPKNFGVVYVEENYLRQISGHRGNFNEIVVKLNSENDIDKTSEFLKENLDKYGIKRVVKKDEQLSFGMVNQEIEGNEKMSQSVPIIFLTFAGIMLANMLSRIVKKDRTSIGVFKALGFTNYEIIVHYLKYASTIGIIGGVIGSLMGTALSSMMTSMYLQYFNIPLLSIKFYFNRILAAILLSLLLCMTAGLFGIRGILKINPAESMQAEAPKQGKRIFLEHVKFIWNKLSFSWKMVLRNIFREQKKFLLIAAAVSITCSMLIMTFWMNDLIDVMFNKHYTEFMKMQYNVGFTSFLDKNTKNEFSKILNADDIEGRVELPFEIVNGNKSKIVTVIGLEKNTVFYDVGVFDEGIIISSNLADYLNVRKGDKILLKNFMPDKDDGYVIVKEIINQSLGINGYMSIDYMNKLFLDKDIINGVYINSLDNVSKILENVDNISSIQSQSDMKDMFEEITGMTAISIGSMIIFSGLLGFVIVYSMTLMSINERALEFSALRVMGFTTKEIFYMLIKENSIMSFIGIILGIPLGKVLIDYMGKMFSTDIYTMKEPLTVYEVVSAVIFTIVFLILAQLITYVKIHKLDFMQSLKSRIS